MAQSGGRFQVRTLGELLDAPEPEFVVSNILLEDSLMILYGPSGAGKSFLGISWAMAIATGTPWLGREVKQRRVLYVAAEGARGIAKRARAWIQEERLPIIDGIEGLRFITDTVLFTFESVEFLQAVDDFKPEVVIVDTLADCFAGGDENLVKDVSAFIAQVQRVRRELGGATFVLIHHTGHDQSRERGSSRLRNSADTVVGVRQDKGSVLLANDKQRDFESFDDIALKLTPIEVIHNGRVYQSATLHDGGVNPVTTRSKHLLGKGPADLLRLLQGFPNATALKKAWRDRSGLPDRTFHAHCRVLQDGGYIERPEKGAYSMTAKGNQFLEGVQVQ